MADCTKTAEFLREYARLCGNGNCQECPIWREKAIAIPCVNYIQNHQAEVLTIVQKWSDEHPVMTWAGKLKELLPNVDMSKIIGTCCPYNLLGGEAPNMETCRSSGDYEDCVNCWNSEYKEAT